MSVQSRLTQANSVLEGDVAAVVALDPRLRLLATMAPPLRIPVVPNAFEALCLIVVYQQISGRVAERIAKRVRDAHPGVFDAPERVLAVGAAALRQHGIPEKRVETILRIAHAVQDGSLNLAELQNMDDASIAQHLGRIKGLGDWSIGMFLLFHLNRPDVFLAGDVGIRQAIQNLVGEPQTPLTATDVAAAWRPHRSAAMWLLWHSLPDFPSPGIR